MDVYPLRIERERLGWSRAYLAEQLGVSVRTVMRWEQRKALPYPYYREQLSTLFNKTIAELGFLTPDEPVIDPQAPVASEEETHPTASQPTIASPSSQKFLDPLIPASLAYHMQLVGRAKLFTHMKKTLLLEDDSAATAIYGLPGIGKTALAVALVIDTDLQKHFSDGVLWAGLGPFANVLSILTRWGSLLGLSSSDIENPTDIRSWAMALHAIVGKKRMLLVIDDAWEAEAALACLVGGPNCKHLLTTRLPQVAYAFSQKNTLLVPELQESDGLTLLARYVAQLVEEQQESATQLVQIVGGLPLAITLLGKYLASQAFGGQQRRLQAALTRLKDGAQRIAVSMPDAVLEHPRGLSTEVPISLRTTIEMSVAPLPTRTQSALYALALFPAKPNTFPEEAFQAISEQPLEVLDMLWDVGLVESAGVGRYTLHQTIADYGRSQKQQHPVVKQRLVRYTALFLQMHQQDYELIEIEARNVQAGLDAAIELGTYREFIAALVAFAPYLRVRGRYAIANHYFQEALRLADPDDSIQRALILRYIAEYAELRGEYDQTDQYCQQALQLVGPQQQDIASFLLSLRGSVAWYHGDNTHAQRYFQQSLDLARQIDDQKSVCKALGLLGRLADRQLHYTRAERLLLEALQLARQLHDKEMIILPLAYLAGVARDQGHYIEGRQYCLEGLAIARQLRHREYISLTLNNLAGIEWSLGNLEQAEAYYIEMLTIARQIGNRQHICRALAGLGMILTYPFQKKYQQAETYLREGVELGRQIKQNNVLPQLLMSLGVTLGVQGDYDQANRYLKESVDLAREQRSQWHLAAALTYWGVLDLKFQKIDAAVEAFQQVLTLDKGSKQDPQFVAESYYGLATIAAARGNLADAYRYGQESLLLFESIKHYMTPEVKRWLQGLPEKQQQYGADRANARINEQTNASES